MSEDKKRIKALVAAQRFVQCFTGVFDDDWEFTKDVMSDDNIGFYISDNETFCRLNGTVKNWSNNWGNRGALISSYYELLEALTDAGLEVTPPGMFQSISETITNSKNDGCSDE